MCESLDDYANICLKSLFPDHFIYWKFLLNDWYYFGFILKFSIGSQVVDQMLVVMDRINHLDHFLLHFVLELYVLRRNSRADSLPHLPGPVTSVQDPPHQTFKLSQLRSCPSVENDVLFWHFIDKKEDDYFANLRRQKVSQMKLEWLVKCLHNDHLKC